MSLYTVPMILVSFSQKLKLYSGMFIDILQFSGKKNPKFHILRFSCKNNAKTGNFTIFWQKIMLKLDILQFSGKKCNNWMFCNILAKIMQKFDIFKFYGKIYTKLGFSGKNNAKVGYFTIYYKITR